MLVCKIYTTLARDVTLMELVRGNPFIRERAFCLVSL